MAAFIINQEAFLDLYATRLGINRADLSDHDIRFGLAQYHAVYLPVAALIELRANELDKQKLYAAFGFDPNVSSLAIATLRVTVATAPSGLPYHLDAPFIVEQGGKLYTATEDLTFEVGQTQADVEIVAQTDGVLGTPVEGTAKITASVGWLRGAIIQVENITPGIDGDDQDTIARNFRAFAANPDSLVRAEDHSDYLMEERDDIGRAIATPRLEVTWDGSTWTKGAGTNGHLTVAVLDPDAALHDGATLQVIKDDLLEQTVPYGAGALHVVPIDRKSITGSVSVKALASADADNLKTSIVDRLNEHLSWETWTHQKHIYAGELWGVIAQVSGVEYVTGVTVNGSLLDGSVSNDTYELEPWELPNGSWTIAMVTVT